MRNCSGRTAVEVALFLLVALIMFAGLVEGVANWLRAGSAPMVEGANAVNTDPLLTWENMPKVLERKARQIAIKEVNQREGWVGTVTQAERGEFHWCVTVGREPNVSRDYRIVAIDADTGKVADYERSKPGDSVNSPAKPQP
jgi:hypothetical protein